MSLSHPSFQSWNFQTLSVASQSALCILSSQEEGLPQITVLMEVMEGGRRMSPVHRKAGGTCLLSSSVGCEFFKGNRCESGCLYGQRLLSGEECPVLKSVGDAKRTVSPFSWLQNPCYNFLLQKPFPGNAQRTKGVLSGPLCVTPGPATASPPGSVLGMQIPRPCPISMKP